MMLVLCVALTHFRAPGLGVRILPAWSHNTLGADETRLSHTSNTDLRHGWQCGTTQDIGSTTRGHANTVSYDVNTMECQVTMSCDFKKTLIEWSIIQLWCGVGDHVINTKLDRSVIVSCLSPGVVLDGLIMWWRTDHELSIYGSWSSLDDHLWPAYSWWSFFRWKWPNYLKISMYCS